MTLPSRIDSTPQTLFSRLSLIGIESQKSSPHLDSKQCRKLNDEQLNRCSELLDPNTKYTLTPTGRSDPSRPAIQFNIAEILRFLYHNFSTKKISSSPASISGGAACYVLTGLKNADVDLTFNIDQPAFPEIHTILVDFIKSKLDLSKFETEKEITEHINTFYLFDSTIIDNQWAYINLGELELKIVFGKNGRHHVSTSDSFYIPITNDQLAYCESDDYDQALDALQKREMIVHSPHEVDNLIFRILHKQTQGFAVIDPNSNTNTLKIALQQFLSKYPHNRYDCIGKLNLRFQKFLHSHYSQENHVGKMIACLNFLDLIQQIEPKDASTSYCKIIASLWKSERLPVLKLFSSLIEQNPANTRDLLAFIRGIFFLEWVNENPNISAYKFDFTKDTNRPRFHFGLQHEHGTHFLTIPSHPGKLIEDFLSSWRNLEQRLGSNLNNLVTDLGFPTIILSKENRPMVVKALFDSYTREPVSHTLQEVFNGVISPIRFCEVIQHETELIQKESPNILSHSYITYRNLQLQINHYRQSLYGTDINVKGIIEAISSNFQPPYVPNAALIKSITQEFSKSANPQVIDPRLFNLLQRCINFLIQQSNPDYGTEMLNALQELITTLHDKMWGDAQYRSTLVLTLLANWPITNPTTQANIFVPMHAFIQKVASWLTNTPALSITLENLNSSWISMMGECGMALAHRADFVSASYCLEKLMSCKPSHKLNADIQKLFYKLVELVINYKVPYSLQAMGLFAKQMITRFPIDEQQSLVLFNLARTISSHTVHQTLGKELYESLAKKTEDKEIHRKFFSDRISDLIVSTQSDIELKQGLNQTIDSLNGLPNVPKDFLASLQTVSDLEGGSRQNLLHTLLLALIKIDFSLAKEIFESKAFLSLAIAERKRISINLVKSLLELDLELDFAYTLWNFVVENSNQRIGIKDVAVTLQLLCIVNDQCIPHICKVIFQLEDDPKKLNAQKQLDLRESVVQTIQFFIKKEREDISDQLATVALKNQWISPKQLLSTYQERIQKDIESGNLDVPLVRKYLDVMFGNQEFLSLEKSAETLRSISQYCSKSNESLKTQFYWEIIHRFFNGCSWNDSISEWCTEIIASFTPEYLDGNPAAISFIEIILKQGHLKTLPFTALSTLFNALAHSNHPELTQKLTAKILKIKLPSDKALNVFVQFLEYSLTKMIKTSIGKIIKQFLDENLLVKQSLPLSQRSKGYTLMFEYLFCLEFHAGEELVANLQLVEEQWEHAKTILPQGSKELAKVTEYVIKAYTVFLPEDKALIKAIKILTPKTPQDPIYPVLIFELLSTIQYSDVSDAHLNELLTPLLTLLDNILFRIMFEYITIKRKPPSSTSSIEIDLTVLKSLKMIIDVLANSRFNNNYHLVSYSLLLFRFIKNAKEYLPSAYLSENHLSSSNSYIKFTPQEFYHILCTIHLGFFEEKNSAFDATKTVIAEALERLATAFFNSKQREEYSCLLRKVVLKNQLDEICAKSKDRTFDLTQHIVQIEYYFFLCSLHNRELGLNNMKILMDCESPTLEAFGYKAELFLKYQSFYVVDPISKKSKPEKKTHIEQLLKTSVEKAQDFNSETILHGLLDAYLEFLDFNLGQPAMELFCQALQTANATILLHDLSLNNFTLYQKQLALMNKLLLGKFFDRANLIDFLKNSPWIQIFNAFLCGNILFQNTSRKEKNNYKAAVKANNNKSFFGPSRFTLIRQMILNSLEKGIKAEPKNKKKVAKEPMPAQVLACVLSSSNFSIPNSLTTLEKANILGYFEKLENLAKTYAPKFIAKHKLKFDKPKCQG